jgi:MFS family permease
VRATRAVLASPDQRRIQFGWAGCITAEGAQLVALGVYTFDAGGVVAVGLLGVVRTLPAAVVGPFVAAAVDRWARSRVLSSVLLTRAAALAAIAVLVAVGAPVAAVLAVASADAIAFSLYWPVHSALQPEIARTADELTAANATTTSVENVGTLVGPAFAGALLAVAPVPLVLVTVAVLLLTGAAAVHGVPATQRRQEVSASTVRGLFEGFIELASQPSQRLVAGIYLAQALCLGAVPLLVVVSAMELLGMGKSGVGSLHAAIGAGGLAGSVGALLLVGRDRLAVALACGVAVWGLCLALVGLLPLPLAALVLLAGLGVCNALVDVSALTLLQRLVPHEVLGPTLGAFLGIWWGALGLGALVASLLVETLGIRGALVGIGSLLPALAVAAGRSLARIDTAASLAATPGHAAARRSHDAPRRRSSSVDGDFAFLSCARSLSGLDHRAVGDERQFQGNGEQRRDARHRGEPLPPHWIGAGLHGQSPRPAVNASDRVADRAVSVHPGSPPDSGSSRPHNVRIPLSRGRFADASASAPASSED